MQIILLDEDKFDSYAKTHPYSNFYQTSNYGKFMSKHTYNSYYLGYLDELDNIKAACLIIVKNEKNTKRKIAYCPRGFLINWDDIELVKLFTNDIKIYLQKRGFTYLKIDPIIIYKHHNIDGSDKSEENNLKFIKNLQQLGYIHMGFNNGYETNKPRWNSITKLDSDITKLYNSISKETRNKINKSISYGNKIYKGNINDMTLFYTIVDKNNPPLDFYMDLYQFFGTSDGLEIYFSKLEPATSVDISKKNYEEELQRNDYLNEQITNFNIEDKNELLNEKMISDNLLSEYKKIMIESINSFQKHPNGIVNATCLVIKYNNTIIFFTTAVLKQYQKTYPDYLLKWQLIEKFAKEGYEMAEYNGMPGIFNNDYELMSKRDFATDIVEYVGEFDLVTNKKSYYTGNKINPIIEWLNKPI